MNKKRRRSSLFVDRRSDYVNETTRAETTTDLNQAELKEYLEQLKKCKTNWASYMEKLKLEYESCREKDKNSYRVSSDNYLDYLDEEDRALIDEMNVLQGLKLKYDGETDRIAEKIEILDTAYRSHNSEWEILAQNVTRAQRTLVMSKSAALAEEPAELLA